MTVGARVAAARAPAVRRRPRRCGCGSRARASCPCRCRATLTACVEMRTRCRAARRARRRSPTCARAARPSVPAAAALQTRERVLDVDAARRDAVDREDRVAAREPGLRGGRALERLDHAQPVAPVALQAQAHADLRRRDAAEEGAVLRRLQVDGVAVVELREQRGDRRRLERRRRRAAARSARRAPCARARSLAGAAATLRRRAVRARARSTAIPRADAADRGAADREGESQHDGRIILRRIAGRATASAAGGAATRAQTRR